MTGPGESAHARRVTPRGGWRRTAAVGRAIAVRIPAMRISISSFVQSLAIALALAPALAACAGDAPDDIERKCTKALYEPCITEHDCPMEACVTFAAEGYQICTQSCDAARACPELGGKQVACNSSGLCAPEEPVDCKIVP